MKYVILACSNDKIFDRPRQLLEVNGEKLISRTIRLLKENGINDILVIAKDKRFYDLGVKVHEPQHNTYDYITRKGYWMDAFPIEIMNEPMCFIWGDVYFSENAIKTIVENETNTALFFCVFENHTTKYIKKWDEPLAYKVQDMEMFKRGIEETKRLYDEKVTWRNPIVWELYRVLHGQNVNVHQMTTDYIAINDETTDIDGHDDIYLLNKVLGGETMVKVKVIEDFTLGRFAEIKDTLERCGGKNQEGYLYVGDIFKCDNDLADYLMKTNKEGRAFVEVVEIIPEEDKSKEKDNEKEVKPKKTTNKKTTKSVAKK